MVLLVGKRGEGDDYGIGSDKNYTILEIADILRMEYKLVPEKGNRLDASLKTSKTKKEQMETNHNLKTYLRNEIKNKKDKLSKIALIFGITGQMVLIYQDFFLKRLQSAWGKRRSLH